MEVQATTSFVQMGYSTKTNCIPQVGISLFPMISNDRLFLGSGKTSLLDVITGRSSGRVTGKIFYNNYVCTRQVIKQRATYIMQADKLLPNLTVKETLRYTARLKLPGRCSDACIETKVL